MSTNLAEEILTQFPIRKKGSEKTAFLEWASQRLKEWGWDCRIEKNGRTGQRNLVAGNPETAVLLLVAHYDTPARKLLPDMIFLNPVWFAVYQLLNIAVLLILPATVFILIWQLTANAIAAFWAFLLCYIGLLLLQIRGPGNRHNNNASSGLLALMEITRALPPEDRRKVALLFTDSGECGHLGGKAWSAAHQKEQFTRLTVELGTIGVGESLHFISTALCRKCIGYGALKRMIEEEQGMLHDAKGLPLGGDYRQFKCGAQMLYTRKNRMIGYFVPFLHTPADTKLDEKNLERVAGMMTEMIRNLGK